MTALDVPHGVVADYFDGRSARARRAFVHVDSGELTIEADDVVHRVPLAGLAWPERTRHGARLMHLPDGGSLHCRDSIAWDAWSAHAGGRRESLVVRAQQRWRWVAASLLAIALIVGAGYRWGLPLAADAIVANLPPTIDEGIGDAALATLDRQRLVGPSRLGAAQQVAIRRSFSEAVARLTSQTEGVRSSDLTPSSSTPPKHGVRPEGQTPYRLEFRSGGEIGPNAFALPGGTIVITDELVDLVHGERGIVLGVLGHELGHLQHRHGMRMLIEAGAVSAAAGALYGDFSTLLAVVPTWLAQAKYSRDAEREADLEAVHLLRASDISPNVMSRFFAALRQPGKGDRAAHPMSSLGLGLASHPADAERIAFFEQAAAAR